MQRLYRMLDLQYPRPLIFSVILGLLYFVVFISLLTMFGSWLNQAFFTQTASKQTVQKRVYYRYIDDGVAFDKTHNRYVKIKLPPLGSGYISSPTKAENPLEPIGYFQEKGKWYYNNFPAKYEIMSYNGKEAVLFSDQQIIIPYQMDPWSLKKCKGKKLFYYTDEKIIACK